MMADTNAVGAEEVFRLIGRVAINRGEVAADLQSIDRQAEQTSREIKSSFDKAERGISDAAQRGAKKSVEEYKKAAQAMQQTGQQVQAAGMAMSAAITLPLVALGVASLKAAGNFEQAQIAFTSMLGSGEKATKLLKDLQTFAAKTPFEFTGLLESTRRLTAFGFAADKVIPMLTDIGDAVSALGGSTDMLNRVVIALGQMQAKGKASAQEMMQLAEAGIPAWQMLADAIGTSTAKAMKLSEKGAISAKVAIEAVLRGMRERFGGMMEEQSKSLVGMWSNLIDLLNQTLTKIGMALMPAAKNLLNTFMPLLGKIQESAEGFSNLSPRVQSTVVVLTALLAILPPIIVGLGALITSLGTLRTAAIAAGAAMKGFTGSLAVNPYVLAVVALLAVIGISMARINAYRHEGARALEAETRAAEGNVKAQQAKIDQLQTEKTHRQTMADGLNRLAAEYEKLLAVQKRSHSQEILLTGIKNDLTGRMVTVRSELGLQAQAWDGTTKSIRAAANALVDFTEIERKAFLEQAKLNVLQGRVDLIKARGEREAASKAGPWTEKYLYYISKHPGIRLDKPTPELAEIMKGMQSEGAEQALAAAKENRALAMYQMYREQEAYAKSLTPAQLDRLRRQSETGNAPLTIPDTSNTKTKAAKLSIGEQLAQDRLALQKRGQAAREIGEPFDYDTELLALMKKALDDYLQSSKPEVALDDPRVKELIASIKFLQAQIKARPDKAGDDLMRAIDQLIEKNRTQEEQITGKAGLTEWLGDDLQAAKDVLGMRKNELALIEDSMAKLKTRKGITDEQAKTDKDMLVFDKKRQEMLTEIEKAESRVKELDKQSLEQVRAETLEWLKSVHARDSEADKRQQIAANATETLDDDIALEQQRRDGLRGELHLYDEAITKAKEQQWPLKSINQLLDMREQTLTAIAESDQRIVGLQEQQVRLERERKEVMKESLRNIFEHGVQMRDLQLQLKRVEGGATLGDVLAEAEATLANMQEPATPDVPLEFSAAEIMQQRLRVAELRVEVRNQRLAASDELAKSETDLQRASIVTSDTTARLLQHRLNLLDLERERIEKERQYNEMTSKYGNESDEAKSAMAAWNAVKGSILQEREAIWQETGAKLGEALWNFQRDKNSIRTYFLNVWEEIKRANFDVLWRKLLGGVTLGQFLTGVAPAAGVIAPGGTEAQVAAAGATPVSINQLPGNMGRAAQTAAQSQNAKTAKWGRIATGVLAAWGAYSDISAAIQGGNVAQAGFTGMLSGGMAGLEIAPLLGVAGPTGLIAGAILGGLAGIFGAQSAADKIAEQQREAMLKEMKQTNNILQPVSDAFNRGTFTGIPAHLLYGGMTLEQGWAVAARRGERWS